MKKIEFEAKNKDDAMKEAVEIFRVHESYIQLTYTEKKNILGLKKGFHVEAKINVDLPNLGLETLKTLFENMGILAKVSLEESDQESITYLVDTEENPLLIGKNGKTLEAIQYYMRNFLNLFTDEHVMVLVDIGGYKENRRKQLEILATKTAKDVARTKIPVKLMPMNAYERRIIHTKLAEWRDVSTKSEGEHPNRYLVIRPRKN